VLELGRARPFKGRISSITHMGKEILYRSCQEEKMRSLKKGAFRCSGYFFRSRETRDYGLASLKNHRFFGCFASPSAVTEKNIFALKVPF
jgi:hypothetical protein